MNAGTTIKGGALTNPVMQSPNARLSAQSKPSVIIPIFLFLIVFPIQFSLGPIAMNGVRTLIIPLIIPLTIKLLQGKYGRVYAADILFILFSVWVFIAMMVNNPASAAQFAGAQHIEFYGGYVLARAYVRNEADLVAVIKALCVVICASIPFAAFEGLTGRSLVLEIFGKIPVLGSNTLPSGNYGERLGIQRSQFTFTHPIHYGLFCSTGFTLALVGLIDSKKKSVRYLFTLCSTLGVIFSVSSGALLYLFIQLALIIWAWMFRRITWRWILLIAAFVAMYVLIDALSNRTPMKVFMTYATFSPHNAYYRGVIFEWGMINVWGSPIFGIGLKDWLRPAWMVSSSVDNFWLLTTMRFGIPAFVLLVLGFAQVLIGVAIARIEGPSTLYHLRRAWCFTFIGVAFTLSTVHIWWSVYSFIFFLFGAGVWMLNRPKETEDSDEAAAQQDATQQPDFNRPGLRRPQSKLAYTRFPAKDK